MGVAERAGDRRALRLAARGGVVGPLLFVALVVVGGVLYDGYSHVGQTISELGGEGAEFALLQNVNFIVLGVLVIGFAWALARTLGPPHTGAVLVAVFGFSSAMLNGLLPCDLGCQGSTTVGLLHNVFGTVGFVAGVGAMFVLARRWRTEPGWRSHVPFTRTMAATALVGLLAFIAVEAAEVRTYAGLVQRVFVLALLGWIAGTAVRLHGQLAGPRHGRAAGRGRG